MKDSKSVAGGYRRTLRRRTIFSVRIASVGALTLSLAMIASNANAASTSVGLGTATSYAVLGGSTVTNTGGSVLNGDLGVSPGGAATGFPPGIVHGATHTADAAAGQAQSDLITAYNDAAGQLPVTTVPTELGGTTLLPGIYDSSSGTFQITGTLTLNAQGNPNAVFIFHTATTLVTASSSSVNPINGAQACNVFWQVGSSATLGTGTGFQGSILALTSITVTTGATIVGRALARNGAVTLDTNTITVPTCVVATTPAPTGSGGSPGPRGSPTGPGGGGSTTGSNQVGRVPSGPAQTGGGSTAGVQNMGLFELGGALLVASGGAFALRRRSRRLG